MGHLAVGAHRTTNVRPLFYTDGVNDDLATLHIRTGTDGIVVSVETSSSAIHQQQAVKSGESLTVTLTGYGDLETKIEIAPTTKSAAQALKALFAQDRITYGIFSGRSWWILLFCGILAYAFFKGMFGG